jgi:molybdenum cofactor cytidylyltransferase
MTAFPISIEEAASLPVVLVLASGRGERFLASGGTSHKLQADLGGKTVLQRTLDAVRGSGLGWHLEEGDHPGMGDSIAAAVHATRSAPGWMILPADLPMVRPQTLVCIARVYMGHHEALVPEFEGQRCHPVRFTSTCGEALSSLQGNQGAARAASTRSTIMMTVNDAGSVMDIDTLDDLLQAREVLRTIDHSCITKINGDLQGISGCTGQEWQIRRSGQIDFRKCFARCWCKNSSDCNRNANLNVWRWSSVRAHD